MDIYLGVTGWNNHCDYVVHSRRNRARSPSKEVMIKQNAAHTEVNDSILPLCMYAGTRTVVLNGQVLLFAAIANLIYSKHHFQSGMVCKIFLKTEFNYLKVIQTECSKGWNRNMLSFFTLNFMLAIYVKKVADKRLESLCNAAKHLTN